MSIGAISTENLSNFSLYLEPSPEEKKEELESSLGKEKKEEDKKCEEVALDNLETIKRKRKTGEQEGPDKIKKQTRKITSLQEYKQAEYRRREGNIREILTKELEIANSAPDPEKIKGKFLNYLREETIDQLKKSALSEVGHRSDVMSKHTEYSLNGLVFDINVAYAQGQRKTMEDRFVIEEIVFGAPDRRQKGLVCAVMDGHGGDWVAEWASKELAGVIQQTLNKEKELTEEGIWNGLKLAFTYFNEQVIEKAGKDYTLYMDQQDKDKAKVALLGGSTCTLILVLDQQIWTCNLGDGASVLYASKTQRKLILATEQKPSDPRFQKGIEKRSGFVEELILKDGKKGGMRVNGSLGCARAFGNFYLGNHNSVSPLTARPKITSIPTIGEGETIVIACDGFWDVCSKDSCGKALYATQEEVPEGEKIARYFVDTALQAGSQDNVTMILIQRKK